MSFTTGLSSRPCFLTIFTSIPRRSALRRYCPTKSWIPVPAACRACLYQTRALSSGNKKIHLSASSDQQGILFQTPSPCTVPRRAFRTSSWSRDDYRAPSVLRKDLPSQEEGQRSLVSKRFSNVMDHLQSNIFMAGQRLNDLTGYSGIEALKKDIEEQEKSVENSRSILQQAREAYSTAISQRSSSQREVNELLQRKHAWTANDLERFTALYRSDHANEQAESVAHEDLMAVERKAEAAATRLSASILARYHEEQIWSDKIRRMSTWGTWGLMGVNVLLFLVFQIAVEPWRRRRLVKGFEDKVMEALEKEAPPTTTTTTVAGAAQLADMPVSKLLPPPESATLHELPSSIDFIIEPQAAATLVDSMADTSTAETPPSSLESEALSMGALVRDRVKDLFSEQNVTVQRRDITALALESVAAGMALMGLAVLVLLRPR